MNYRTSFLDGRLSLGMAEKIWERWSLFINFENFTDTRQTRFDTMYTGPVARPVFRDIFGQTFQQPEKNDVKFAKLKRCAYICNRIVAYVNLTVNETKPLKIKI